MTLPRYEAIAEHWEKVPPLSVSAAAIAQAMGVKREAPKRKGEQDLQGLFETLGGAGFKTEKPTWLQEPTT